MPLLVALDECNLALTRIERLARQGLEYPPIQAAALMLILAQCYETDLHVGELSTNGALIEVLPSKSAHVVEKFS